MQHLSDRADRAVELIVCNKAGAGVLARAERFNVPTLLIDRASFFDSEDTLQQLQAINPDLIV